MRSIGIHVELPVVVEVDNLGSIFLASNVGSSLRTKHVDIQFRFVREYYENGVTLVQFISTVQQRSDVITKNVDSKTALC